MANNEDHDEEKASALANHFQTMFLPQGSFTKPRQIVGKIHKTHKKGKSSNTPGSMPLFFFKESVEENSYRRTHNFQNLVDL